MSTDIKLYEDQTLATIPMEPAEQVVLATKQADALQGVVNNQNLFVMISGKKHLKAEAWQTITSFDNASFETEYCNPILNTDNEAEAYVAKVNITKHGEVMASGVMVCGFDDFPCRGKNGYAKHRAAMSAAQTWAGAKAARMKYAWVVTMAGYEPTPAEEMREDNSEPHPNDVRPPANPARGRTTNTATTKLGNCEKHRKVWADTPNGVGHPLDGGKWCLRDDVEMDAKPTTEETEIHNLADLKLFTDQVGWNWDVFLVDVLDTDWDEWLQLCGSEEEAVHVAMTRLAARTGTGTPPF